MWPPLVGLRGWLAIRSPRWKIDTSVGVVNTSTRECARALGTE
ncbi:hypothetical protein [Skermanella aerolata]|nr:hypothetical protein [Skermanella aerolata]